MTDAAELQSIIEAWTELIEQLDPEPRNAVSVRARAAAARIRRLERVADVATRLAPRLAGATLATAPAALLLELRTSLQLLDGEESSGGGLATGGDSRRSAH